MKDLRRPATKFCILSEFSKIFGQISEISNKCKTANKPKIKLHLRNSVFPGGPGGPGGPIYRVKSLLQC